MNLSNLIELIDAKKKDALESAWLEAMEQMPPAELAPVLEKLTAAGESALAETLGAMLLAECTGKLSDVQAATLARALVTAAPNSTELRKEAAARYGKAYGQAAHFDAFLAASGLLDGITPRRVFRTLDALLTLQPGNFLANRYEQQVVKVERFDLSSGEWTATDPSGHTIRIPARTLADEYELVAESDFRVLRYYRPDELTRLLDEDPAAVLIGLCIQHGGSIDAVTLKDILTEQYLSPSSWSGWWGRARTAAKRCSQLSLEGRSPIIVNYHPSGLTLEQELTPLVKDLKMPLEYLDLLRRYIREGRQRKLTPEASFAGPLMDALARQARQYAVERPADAVAASLALAELVAAGLPAPADTPPSAAEILALAPRPAEAVDQLSDDSLWPAALDALAARADAPTHLAALLYQAPADRLDLVAQRLKECGAAEALTAAVAKAVAAPAQHSRLFLWLWKAPTAPVENTPGRVELLGRMLQAIQDLVNDWQLEAGFRKETLHRFRAGLSASDYASYRQAISEMDLPVAGTIKRKIERSGTGLAQAVEEDMMTILRESFYALFAKTKVARWLDETTIWTTQAALDKRQAELKHLIDVKMLENAKAIGEAAAHGDLSENSEWKFAIEERDLLAARAKKMQDEIARSHVIVAEDVPTDSVGIGSKVVLRREGDGDELTMTFLGPWDSNIDQGVYSYQTVMAADLMGKGVGETVAIKLEGHQGVYAVEQLGLALEPAKH